jgi:hypothetical protein
MAKEFVTSQKLLDAVIATGAGSAFNGVAGQKTFHLSGTTSAGTGAVTVKVEGSMTGTSWDTIATLSLTLGTTATSDGFTSGDRYALVRGNVTSISGTNATVTLSMGY